MEDSGDVSARVRLDDDLSERVNWREWLEWCRGAELNCLRRPFQGRALPVSYLGTVS